MKHIAKIMRIRKTQLALALVFSAGLFLLPVHGAHAGFLDGVALVTDFVSGILNVVLYLIVQILGYFLAGIGMLADTIMKPTPITTNTVVQHAWGITRDFANMFFILILLGIALDFILFNSFKVKQMIPRLIMIALLINFSLPLAGILIDFANVFTQFFLSQASDTTTGFTGALAQRLSLSHILDGVAQNGTGALLNLYANQNGLLLNLVFAIFFMFGTAFVFLVLALMFIVRTGYLYVLLVTLPIVLVLSAFPPTAGRFKDWSGKFVHWVMFAPIATFFLYFAIIMFDGLVGENIQGQLSGQLNQQGFMGTLYSYVIVWVFILGALGAAQSMGGAASKMALDIANKTSRWTRGQLSNYGRRGLEQAKVATVLEKGAEWAARHPVATLGMGGFVARGLGGGASNIRAAKREGAELSKGEKDMIETGSPEMVTALIESYSKGTPDQRAKAGRMIQLAERKDKLKVKRNGVVDHGATRDLKRRLRAKAKAIGDFATAKTIDQSDFVIGKEAVMEKYGALKKEGKAVDPDTGRPIGEAQERKLADLYRKINLASEDWDDSVVEDDPKFIQDMLTHKVLTAEKFKQAQRSGNTAIIKQFREYMKNPGNELASEENAPFRNWLRGTASLSIVGNYKKQLEKFSEGKELRKETASTLKELRKEAGKEEKEALREMHKQDKKTGDNKEEEEEDL